MLEDFLSKLGASTRITVGVSVSPGIGLEMIEIDRLTGSVNKYGCKPLEYNNSTRDLVDYDHFRSAMEELFEELQIPKKSNIVLSLPNVHFGLISLPVLLTDEAITNAIISEVEQSYIFKRQEPSIAWSEVFASGGTENRTLAYTAIQKDSLTQIAEACEEIGCSLVAVENSYTSLFRALNFLDLAKEQLKENVSWNLMIIMQNNYSIISMSGKHIVEYYEEPLALKSFIDDEIYNAIKTSAQLTLAGLPANYLYIISETDLVSAEVLSMKMSVEGTVKFLECNKYRQSELMPVSLNVLPKLASQITPEAIGSAIMHFGESPLKLNIIKDQDGLIGMGDVEETPRINIGNLEVELTPDFIRKISIILGSIIIIPLIILLLLFDKIIIPKEQAKLDIITTEVTKLNDDIKKYKDANQDAAFDLRSTMDNIVNQNKVKLSYLSALSVSIPNSLWVNSFTLKDTSKVDVKGEASNVKSIYTFYKNLKQLVNNSDIKLYKLKIASDSIDDVVTGKSSAKLYEFEITNMTETELNPPVASEKPAGPSSEEENKQKNQIFSLGKSLFEVKDKQAPNPEINPTQEPQNPISNPGISNPMLPNQGVPNPVLPNQNQLPPNLKKIEKF